MRLFALLLLLLPAVAQAQSTPAFAAKISYGSTSGSGTVVDFRDGKSLVLTVKHFDFAAGAVVSVRVQGRTYPGRVLAVDAVEDMAAIEVAVELPAAYIADRNPPRGSQVRQWGTPWHAQGRHVLKQGTWRGPDNGHYLWATTIASESGDSGSGIFDADGKLVGVCVGVSNRGQVIVPLARIAVFVERLVRR